MEALRKTYKISLHERKFDVNIRFPSLFYDTLFDQTNAIIIYNNIQLNSI